MHLLAEDITIQAFTPDDGSDSAAIKVVHRTSKQEAVNDDTPSQVANLRHALRQLITRMNPNPDRIPLPDFLLFDKVEVRLPESSHEGEVTRVSWDFTLNEWKYYVDCPRQVVSNWYNSGDIDLLDE